MLAELKRLHSPDVQDLRTWAPSNREFAILLQIMAAPVGSPGEESFDVTLCTPAWIKGRVERDGILMGRHLLVVAEYNYGHLYNYVSKYISACSGDSWEEIATKIARLGRWEFEDYRP